MLLENFYIKAFREKNEEKFSERRKLVNLFSLYPVDERHKTFSECAREI